MRADWLARYEPQVAGGRDHTEYWIPAEEVDAFNEDIVRTIEVIAEYHPERNVGGGDG